MAQHRLTPRWRRILARIVARPTASRPVDPGTQLLPIFDPPTMPMPAYSWQTPDEWARQHSGGAR
ncbi:hypothetical protein NONO_c17520 [Nocardia nova SH22a]|uniref:Uncharacterized protein n=1 Tax=Nocardia nova SH22a TaxID=1415166 RepID=W5TBH2_9NOCA|nr:hypothetical protein [Nocardia nova]AHH16552.1 hypothetical protein NONO_c17520 [Nocardia nova SH22a]